MPVTAWTMATPLDAGLPTIGGWIQLVAAAVIPVGLSLVVTQTRTVRWTDLLLAIGVFILPIVLILQLQGVFPPEATAVVFGFGLGHVMEMLDED